MEEASKAARAFSEAPGEPSKCSHPTTCMLSVMAGPCSPRYVDSYRRRSLRRVAASMATPSGYASSTTSACLTVPASQKLPQPRS
eukprot:820268-Prymnesium_polylepis.1